MHFFLVLPTYKLSVVLFLSGKNAFVCIEVTTSLTFKGSFDVINKLHEIIFLLRIKIVALIVFRYIAMITKQKSFNKSLVDRNSQVIFLDEAHAGLLDADDWKILSQGGLTAHDRKYQKTTPTVIRCPMFLTCQKELNFGEDNNAAMDVRLRKFYFKSLTTPPVADVQQYLRDNLGMIKEQDAHLLVSVEGPYHPTIERSREEYFARKKEQDQRMLEEKARDYYRDDWVLDKEHELRQLQKQEDAATDDDVKRAQEYMIQLTVDALKSRFQRNEVPGLSKLALLERRKKAVEMKWLSVKQAQQIHSIWSPLPYPCDDQEGESDDEELFITQSTPPMARSQHSQVERFQQNRNSQKRRSQKGDDRTTPIPKKGRITHFFSPCQK